MQLHACMYDVCLFFFFLFFLFFFFFPPAQRAPCIWQKLTNSVILLGRTRFCHHLCSSLLDVITLEGFDVFCCVSAAHTTHAPFFFFFHFPISPTRFLKLYCTCVDFSFPPHMQVFFFFFLCVCKFLGLAFGFGFFFPLCFGFWL